MKILYSISHLLRHRVMTLRQACETSSCRVGIVGSGWGIFAHLPQFRKAGLSVVAIYSRTEEKAERLALEHGLTYAFSNIADLVQCNDVDLVAISLPSHLRKEAVLAAVGMGKHVLTQPTPPGLSVEDVQHMLQAAQAAGVQLFMDLELRWVPCVQRVRELLDGGCGNSSKLSVEHISFTTTIDLGYLKGRLKTPEDIVWKHDAAKGGGIWATFGLHFVDVVRFLLRDEVFQVTAEKHYEMDEAEMQVLLQAGIHKPAETRILAELKTMQGVQVSLNLNGRSHGHPQENHMSVECSDGKTIRLDFLSSSMTLLAQTQTGDEQVLEAVPGEGTAFTQVGEPKLAAAINAMLSRNSHTSFIPRQKDLATIEDGLVLQFVNEAVDLSAENGGTWQVVRQITPKPDL